MKRSDMTCPVCDSANVREMDNLRCLWACGDCGHTGDGADFVDVREREFTVPDPSEHHPECQCAVCRYGQGTWVWLFHPSEY